METPELDADAQRRWKAYLDGKLAAVDLLQNQVDLPGLRAPIREVNEIFGGNPYALRRLLTKPERLPKFAEQLGVTSDELLAELHRCALHQEPGYEEWHPAFPGIRSGAIEIEAPFWSSEGQDWKQLLTNLRKRQPVCVWVNGLTGSGATTLASELARELDAELVDTPPPNGWTEWRRNLEESAVVLAPPPRRSDDAWVQPKPWGPEQVREVVRQLGALPEIDSGYASRLEAVAAAIEETPEILGPARTARTVLATLASYARDGAPSSGADARSRVVNAAWSSATRRQGAERLALLGDGFLESFWSRRWLKSTSAIWTAMPRSEALGLIAAVSDAPNPARVRELLEQLRAERSTQKRSKLVDEVASLQAGTPEELLAALEASGLLVREGSTVHAAESALALVWAARGLGPEPASALLEAAERLLDPDWGTLCQELGFAGAEPDDMLSIFTRLPAGYRIDAARGLMEYIATLDAERLPIRFDTLIREIWATALWGSLRDPFGERWSGDAGGGFYESARIVSRRFRGRLRQLVGPDFITSLEQDVNAEVWPAFPGEAADSDLSTADLMRKAPYQAIPFTDEQSPWTAMSQAGLFSAEQLEWMETLARPADSAARRLLTGAGALAGESQRLWGYVPDRVAFRWMEVDDDKALLKLWNGRVRAGGLTKEAIEALRRFPRDRAEKHFRKAIGSVLTSADAWSMDDVSHALECAIAGSLASVLHGLVDRAARWAAARERLTPHPEPTWENAERVWKEAYRASVALHRLGVPRPLRGLRQVDVARGFADTLLHRSGTKRLASMTIEACIACDLPVDAAREWLCEAAAAAELSLEDFVELNASAPALRKDAEDLALEVGRWLLAWHPYEAPEVLRAWVRTLAAIPIDDDVVEERREECRRQVDLALVELEDGAVWTGSLSDLDWTVREAMGGSPFWREYVWRATQNRSALLAVPKDELAPDWFWAALDAMPRQARAPFIAGRLDDQRAWETLQRDARAALAADEVHEAGMWLAVAASSGRWPDFAEETLRHWMLDDDAPFDGDPWFPAPTQAERVTGGWASLFNLAQAWPEFPSCPWAARGVERLYEYCPDDRYRQPTPCFEAVNFEPSSEPSFPHDLRQLAERVDARALCDRFAESTEPGRWADFDLAAWRLRDLPVDELEALLEHDRWGPHAARRLIEHGDERGRLRLLALMPPKIEEATGLPWLMIRICLPVDALAAIDAALSAIEGPAKKLDLISAQFDSQIHPELSERLRQLQREVVSGANRSGSGGG